MLPVYIATIFVSASLLFVVQPMVGKMVLPALGGSPAVWNTCMVFFQAVLLAGYGYAHLSRKLGFRVQSVVHVAFQLGALALLPIAIDLTALADASSAPIGPLLLALAATVGVPFLVVSASAPLFQDWFGRTDHPDADDPYHLYAASNAGSMLSLLSYPILIEPNLDVVGQAWWWRVGYVILIGFTIASAVMAWRRGAASERREEADEEVADIAWGRRLYWIFAAFIPSSLLLGVTTTLTTDVAAVPLFWVVPLALYLGTFILVFARRTIISHAVSKRALLVIAAPFVIVFVLELASPLWLMASLHLIVFFLVAMVFHGELARTRPAASGLTEFYFWMSFGGVLGGAFNGLFAPLVFSDLWEYPLVFVLAAVACSRLVDRRGDELRLDMIASVALTAAIVFAGRHTVFDNEQLGFAVIALSTAPIAARYFRPRLYGVGIAIAVLMGEVAFSYNHEALYQERSFFSVSRVVHSDEMNANFLLHGNTNHGAQSHLEGYEDWGLPYNYPDSPLAQLFGHFGTGQGPIAVLGLGVGAHACFAAEDQEMVFFEIDPSVETIATDPRYFDFLERCGGDYSIIMGDGRIMLERQPDRRFDLIVMDAFTSDAIPTHIVTTEALESYLKKLEPGGVLVFHITNRYLDLAPMLAAQAERLGLVGRVRHAPAPDIEAVTVATSTALVLARSEDDLGPLLQDERWEPLERRPGVDAWTDTFSNVIDVYRWE